VMFEYLPIGRYLYVLGSNPRAAELTGISARVYIPFAFILSGVITAFAGVVLGSRLGVAQTTVGPDYLLPAFVGALLGSTAIKPGRVNVLGTIVAVFVLAVAVAGLQQMGAQFFVEPLFNGTMLILAVGLAAYASRRRARVRAAADAAGAGPGERREAPPVAEGGRAD
jgi:ribose transport system permease protein